jgi:hypothetical protein
VNRPLHISKPGAPLMSDGEFETYVTEIGNAVAALRPEGVNGNDVCNGMATALGRFLGGLLPPGSDTIGPANEFRCRHAPRGARCERCREEGMTMRPLHFVGFKDDRYWNAVAVFGLPDFYHRVWDKRAWQEVQPNDIAVFASGSSDDPPKPISWDDSQQDIIARGVKGIHW